VVHADRADAPITSNAPIRPWGGTLFTMWRRGLSPAAISDHCSGYPPPDLHTAPKAGQILRQEAAMHSVMSKVATIECSTWPALLELYPQNVVGEPSPAWSTRDEALCKAPPVWRCPHAVGEIKPRFPGFDG